MGYVFDMPDIKISIKAFFYDSDNIINLLTNEKKKCGDNDVCVGEVRTRHVSLLQLGIICRLYCRFTNSSVGHRLVLNKI